MIIEIENKSKDEIYLVIATKEEILHVEKLEKNPNYKQEKIFFEIKNRKGEKK